MVAKHKRESTRGPALETDRKRPISPISVALAKEAEKIGQPVRDLIEKEQSKEKDESIQEMGAPPVPGVNPLLAKTGLEKQPDKPVILDTPDKEKSEKESADRVKTEKPGLGMDILGKLNDVIKGQDVTNKDTDKDKKKENQKPTKEHDTEIGTLGKLSPDATHIGRSKPALEEPERG